MYGKILQLELIEVDEDNKMEDYHIDENDSFMGVVAESFEEVEDRKEITSIITGQFVDDKSCIDSGIKVDLDRMSIRFTEEYKDIYFKARYDSLTDIVCKMSYEDFKYDTTRLWQLMNCVNDKFGYYVFSGGVLMTYQEFLRTMKADVEYHFGSVYYYNN